MHRDREIGGKGWPRKGEVRMKVAVYEEEVGRKERTIQGTFSDGSVHMHVTTANNASSIKKVCSKTDYTKGFGGVLRLTNELILLSRRENLSQSESAL